MSNSLKLLILSERNGTRCTSDSQCSGHLTCKNRQCVNPCIDKVCAPNAECTATNHRAICSCSKGFDGHPTTGCRKEEKCTYNPDCPADLSCRHGKCVDACATECTNRRKCRVISHVPFCE